MDLNKSLEEFDIKRLFTNKELQDLKKSSYIKVLKKNEVIQRDNNQCVGVPFVLNGNLQLFSLAESGRKMNIYKVKKGELCVLAALCIVTEKPYEFMACAEQETEIIMINASFFRELIDSNLKFNKYVLSLISEKLIDSLMLHEKVHLTPIRERLVLYLNKNANKENIIRKTHESIANDLATSRVVISREISKLRKENKIITERNYIKLIKKKY